MINPSIIPNGYMYHYITDPFSFNGDYLVVMETNGISMLELTEFGEALEIRQISVEPNSRMKGKGNLLLELATKIAKNSDKKTISLDVISYSWMEDWYRRHGFEIDGISVYDKNYTNLIKKL